MNKDEFIYKIQANKTRVYLGLSILLLIIIGCIGFFIVSKSDISQNFGTVASSNKYILANNLIGIKNDGSISLYNSKSGKVVDSLSLEGNFLIDVSDNLKEVYLLNKSNGELNILTAKNNKINRNIKKYSIRGLNSIESFDYENNFIVLLSSNKRKFLIKSSENDIFTDFTTGVVDDINHYRIVEDNLIFTSGEYIYSKNLNVNTNNNSTYKVTQNTLQLRDKENIYGSIICEIPSGTKIEILGQGSTGWYLTKYDNKEGYVSNISSNFKDESTKNGGIIKIHIGEFSSYIHELDNKVFINNKFGEDRGMNILIDINPETLYINNLIKYNSLTSPLISNKDDSRLYINNISTNNKGIHKQIIKYSEIENLKEKRGYNIESKTILNTQNTYACFGYIYYKDDKGLNIFNIKSNDIELTIDIKEDFFAPLY